MTPRPRRDPRVEVAREDLEQALAEVGAPAEKQAPRPPERRAFPEPVNEISRPEFARWED